jgi:hypothetical protein
MRPSRGIRQRFYQTILLWATAAALLAVAAGCTPPTDDSYNPLPSGTPTLTLTIAPSRTPRLRPTSPPGSTITPTPLYNLPGDYFINLCVSRERSRSITYTLCVSHVKVLADRSLVVSVTQAYHNIPGNVSLIQPSYEGIRSIYLQDNAGNHYNHIKLSGAAELRWTVQNDLPMVSEFFFDKPLSEATSFTFRDDMAGVVVGPFELATYNPTPEG